MRPFIAAAYDWPSEEALRFAFCALRAHQKLHLMLNVLNYGSKETSATRTCDKVTSVLALKSNLIAGLSASLFKIQNLMTTGLILPHQTDLDAVHFEIAVCKSAVCLLSVPVDGNYRVLMYMLNVF